MFGIDFYQFDRIREQRTRRIARWREILNKQSTSNDDDDDMDQKFFKIIIMDKIRSHHHYRRNYVPKLLWSEFGPNEEKKIPKRRIVRKQNLSQ